MMGIFSIPLVIFFFFLFNASAAEIKCMETAKCSLQHHSPTIKYPFKLKNIQPQNCGKIGFDLSCTNDTNQTILELPLSTNLVVNKIDYKSQTIHVSIPNGCLPNLLSHLNLSSTPFHYYNYFEDSNANNNYTLFNCSYKNTALQSSSYSSIPCLSSHGYNVYALNSTLKIKDVMLTYCTKLYNLYSVPNVVFNQHDDLVLSWNSSCLNQTQHECYNIVGQLSKGARKQVEILVSILSFVAAISLPLIVLHRVIYTRTNQKDKDNEARIEKFLENYRSLIPTRYSCSDIKKIANNLKNEIGAGAYGTVYKGKLSNEILVAVKVLKSSTGSGAEFINEVGTMSKIHHVNIVRLVGFCADGHKRALVYEYLPNGSLQKFISTTDFKNHFLTWEKLQEIALGIAKGIEYLHQGCNQRILHFDIKPHNILLDQNFNPKLSDFGLAKLCSKDEKGVSMTTARGTAGYMAPEVFSRSFGEVSYKSDVYSFGMLLLEMVGGKENDTNVDVGEKKSGINYGNFPEWIYYLLEKGSDLREHIEVEKYAKIAKKLSIVGLWCIQWDPIDRPSMQVVVHMLDGDGDNLSMPPNPFVYADHAITNVSVLRWQQQKHHRSSR